jgi:hypothetical protein
MFRPAPQQTAEHLLVATGPNGELVTISGDPGADSRPAPARPLAGLIVGAAMIGSAVSWALK